MSKNFDIKKWKEQKLNENTPLVRRLFLKEDGGTYETKIFIQDSGENFYVQIEDSEGHKEKHNFTSLKEVYDYMLAYMSKWDVS